MQSTPGPTAPLDEIERELSRVVRIASFPNTNTGNAERLVEQHGDDILYCPPLGGWLTWDGRRWVRDTSGDIWRRSIATVRAIYREAEQAADRTEAKELARWAEASESERNLAAMISITRAMRPAESEQFDADPWLLNVENGTVDLRTGELRPHRRGDRITKLAPVAYDPDAEAPVWAAFLERIMPDAGLRAFLAQAVGYTLTGDVSEHCVFICYGTGRNGKSVFLGALQGVMGRDYAQQMPSSALMARRTGGPTPELADLRGVRFAATSETSEGARMNEEVLKAMSGGDLIRARHLHAEHIEFFPMFKVWLATNHRPVIRGTDEGVWSRPKLIPFTVTIPEQERDRQLAGKLAAEAPGILAWAVRGCLEWHERGLVLPDIVQEATGEYRNSMDTINMFIEECCVLGEGFEVNGATLFNRYREWAKDNNEYEYTHRRFGENLTERGFEVQRVTSGPEKGRKVRLGIGLADGYSFHRGQARAFENDPFETN
jgi:putative DNA primase/helicase